MGLVQIGGEIRSAPLNQNFQYLDGKHLYGDDAAKPSPAQIGRLYVALDTGIIYADIGTAWIPVGGGSVPAHASTHATGGSDPLTPADIGAASQVDFDAHLADLAKYARFQILNNQSIPHNAFTQIFWEHKTSFNEENFCSLESGRIKILEEGLYQVILVVGWAGKTEGQRRCVIETNVSATVFPTQASSFYVSASHFVYAPKNKLLSTEAFQTSGSSLDILAGGNTNLFIRKVV